MNKAIKGLILFAVFAVPVMLVPGLRDNFALPKVGFLRFIAVLLALFILAGAAELKELKVKGIVLAAFVYLFVRIMATLFSINPALSWSGLYLYYFDGTFQIICFLIVFFAAGIQVSQDSGFERGIYKTIATACILSGLYGIMQFAGFDFMKWENNFGRIFSTLGNPDFFAGWLLLCLPVIFGCFIEAETKGDKMLFAAASVLAFINFVIASSRAGWLGFLAASVVILSSRVTKEKKKAALFILPAALIILFFALFGSRGWKTGMASRIMGWKAGLKVAGQKPVTGWGPDSFSSISVKYLPPEYQRLTKANANPAYTHNIFLDQAVDAGIPGLIAFLWLVAEFYVENSRRIFLSAAVTGGLVYGFFSIGSLSFWLYMWLYFGIVSGEKLFDKGVLDGKQ